MQVDQAWGMFQASVAAHDNHAAYYCNSNSERTTANVRGGGTNDIPQGIPTTSGALLVSWRCTIKNIPTGAGDTINVQGVYTNGATRYNIQDLASQAGAGHDLFRRHQLSLAALTRKRLASVLPLTPCSIRLMPLRAVNSSWSSTWGMRGAFNHNWDPYWSTCDLRCLRFCPLWSVLRGPCSAETVSWRPTHSLPATGFGRFSLATRTTTSRSWYRSPAGPRSRT